VTDSLERVATVAVDAPSREPALVVDQLTKRFGERTAFSGVTFEVAYGEVFGFLGPNGAGKTTTVRALGTLIDPTWRRRPQGAAGLPAQTLDRRGDDHPAGHLLYRAIACRLPRLAESSR
jgi:ABC-type glutathione transport system ATPase component